MDLNRLDRDETAAVHTQCDEIDPASSVALLISGCLARNRRGHSAGNIDPNFRGSSFRLPTNIYMETGGPVKMIDGEVPAPEEPGMSSEVSAEEIRKYKVG